MQQTIAKKLNASRHKIALKKLSSPPIKIIKLPSNPPDVICIAPIIPFAKPEFSFSTDEIESTTTLEITNPFPTPYMKQAIARAIGKDKESSKQKDMEQIAINDQ